MLKRMFPLLALLVVAGLAAPSAMATDCYRCKIRSLPHTEPPQCIVVSLGPRFYDCVEDFEADTCILTNSCTTLAQAETVPALASEFAVASVERLDDATPTAQPTQLASAR